MEQKLRSIDKEKLKNLHKSPMLTKAILFNCFFLPTFGIDKHKNRDAGNTSERQNLRLCLQYVYSENVSD